MPVCERCNDESVYNEVCGTSKKLKGGKLPDNFGKFLAMSNNFFHKLTKISKITKFREKIKQS